MKKLILLISFCLIFTGIAMADDLKHYANVVDDKIANIAVFEGEPAFNPSKGYWLDVTGLKAGKGYLYNETTKEFTAPVPEPLPKPEPEIDTSKITQDDINKLILKKLGYKVKEQEEKWEFQI